MDTIQESTQFPETRALFEGFRVGDRIKAYDFEPMEGRRDRYAVGYVEAVVRPAVCALYAHYLVRVEHDSLCEQSGEQVMRDVIKVPFECAVDFDGRVNLCSPVEQPLNDADWVVCDGNNKPGGWRFKSRDRAAAWLEHNGGTYVARLRDVAQWWRT